MHGKIQKSQKRIIYNKRIINFNKFKISAPTLNEEIELSDRSYSLLDIQDYLEYILNNPGKKQLIL